MDKRFEGQVAIVTGGASGIGAAIADRLLREGAAVTVFDLDETALTRWRQETIEFADRAHGVAVDVADEHDVEHAMQDVVASRGRLDIVVHCAGIVGPNARDITEVAVEEFDRVYRVNVRASFLITKHAIPLMQKNSYGRILLFASVAGKEGNAGMCPYSMSKAAVIGLVKSVGKEFATSGITINAIAPAVIRTGMVEAMNPQQVEYMTDRIPMKRCGTLEEAASMSCWIVSKEASFNTAAIFDLTGGRATY